MPMNEEKLIKIARMAMQGIGGEKIAAREILKKLGKTPEEILENLDNKRKTESSTLITVIQSFKDKSEFEILKQLYFKITNKESISFWRNNSRKFSFEASREEARKYKNAAKTILKLYRKEHEKFVEAFIQANNLFSEQASNPNNDNMDSGYDFPTEDILEIIRMARNIKTAFLGDLLDD